MKRLVTAAVLIPVVLYAVFRGPWWVLLGVIAVISALCLIEYCQILEIEIPSRILGLLAGLELLILPLDRVFLPMLLFALIAFALPLRKLNLTDGFAKSAALFLGVFYTFGSMKSAYLLGSISPWWLTFALAINWVGDSGAYYIGRRMGRRKLAPRISPGKSWEGAIASLIFSVIFGILLLPRVLPVPLLIAALLAFVGNIAGQVGDLAESALKRAAGVKDSGKLLPGHGGMLDRVDSVLFSVPVVYSFMLWLHL